MTNYPHERDFCIITDENGVEEKSYLYTVEESIMLFDAIRESGEDMELYTVMIKACCKLDSWDSVDTTYPVVLGEGFRRESESFKDWELSQSASDYLLSAGYTNWLSSIRYSAKLLDKEGHMVAYYHSEQ